MSDSKGIDVWIERQNLKIGAYRAIFPLPTYHEVSSSWHLDRFKVLDVNINKVNTYCET